MTNPEDQGDARAETPIPTSAFHDEANLPSPNDDERGIAGPSGDDCPAETLFPPRPWGLGAVLAGIVTALAFLGLGLLVITLTVGEGGVVSSLTFNLSLATVVVVILATAWIFGPAMHGGGARSLGLRTPRISRSFSWALLGAVLLAVLTFNAGYVAVVSQLGIDMLQPGDLPFDEFGPLALAASGFLVVLVGPFAEEVFFRGFIQSGLVRRWGPVTGLLVSAAIFGIAHASVAILIPIFVAGLLIGWLYHRTGSLWSCVWVHGAQNGIAFAVALTL